MTFDPDQFSQLLDDAAVDELLFRFMTQGRHQSLRHSTRHRLAAEALDAARQHALPEEAHLGWVDHWLEAVTLSRTHEAPHSPDDLTCALRTWTQENLA